MRLSICGLLALVAGCSSEPSTQVLFECPGKPPFVAVEDPGAGWMNEQGQRVFPSEQCKKTPRPAKSS